jgi:hypothetical protein
MRQSPVNVSPSQLSASQVSTSQISASQVSAVKNVQSLEPNVPVHLKTENFSVRGYWVPGTLDRVILQRLDSPVMLEVHSNRVHQLFGRGAMDPLYLTGKSCFECTVDEWSALKA